MPSEGQADAALILRIAQRDLKAARFMLGQHYPHTHDLALLCALICDLGGDPTPFQPLVRFSPFGTRIRYDEVAPLGLERSLWNQRCADLINHVASLIP